MKTTSYRCRCFYQNTQMWRVKGEHSKGRKACYRTCRDVFLKYLVRDFKDPDPLWPTYQCSTRMNDLSVWGGIEPPSDRRSDCDQGVCATRSAVFQAWIWISWLREEAERGLMWNTSERIHDQQRYEEWCSAVVLIRVIMLKDLY